MRKVPVFIGVAVCLLGSANGFAAQTETRLMLAAEMARPGETVTSAVQMRMPPNWHTYWKNAGDVGMPTSIAWTLPKGVTAGEILWPVPEKHQSGDQIQYIYNDEVLLLVSLSLAADLPPGKIEVQAKVAWLECEEKGLCVPGKSELTASLSVGTASKPSKDAASIEAWQKRLPQRRQDLAARAFWEKAPQDDKRPLLVEWKKFSQADKADFFPGPSEDFLVRGETEAVQAEAGKVRLRKVVEKLSGDWPKEISGLLVEMASEKPPSASEVTLSISGPDQTIAAVSGKKLFGMLGLAFLGGLILNLMPCVLPVIALKIFGFIAQSQQSSARRRQLGLIYGLGVLFSFLVMAGMVIGVQRAGKLASWGMQFGNPYFLVAMTALVTLVALNFFGLFEVTLSGGAMDTASELASKEGGTGAFFNGVLTTALATPCTAPFLAPALGFAFSQPPVIIIAVLLTVGMGLAAPYVLLTFQPGWLKFLPKPGPWMEKFRTAMGFPMLATALYLLSIVDAHYGDEGVLWIGVFLVCVAMAAWLWGQFVQHGTRRKGLATALAALFLVGGYVFALEMQLDWRHREQSGQGMMSGSADEIPWQPWSPAAVEQARKEGRPVLVDFTARWCPNCRWNKKTSIEIPSVRKRLKEINAVALIGDYTRFPPDIGAELKRFERAGVPLVLVYPKDPAAQPEVLPAFLTPSIVLGALDRAANEGNIERDRPKEVQKSASKTE